MDDDVLFTATNGAGHQTAADVDEVGDDNDDEDEDENEDNSPAKKRKT